MYTCKQAIFAMLAASGPQEANDLKHECRTQAHDYGSYEFMAALTGLVTEGRVVRCEDMDDTYELPESAYDAQGRLIDNL